MRLFPIIKTTIFLSGLLSFLSFDYAHAEEKNVAGPNPVAADINLPVAGRTSVLADKDPFQGLFEPNVERGIGWYEYNPLGVHIWRTTLPTILLANRYGPTRVIRCGPTGDQFPQSPAAGGFAACSEHWGKPTTLAYWAGVTPLSGIEIYLCTEKLDCTKHFSYP